jgi:hypothetical protein
MNDIYRALAKITIQHRINEASTSFNTQFNNPLDPDEYDTGESFEYTIIDNTLPEGHLVIEGLIETVDVDLNDNNKIWGLSGRDKGLELTTTKYKVDSTEEDHTEHTVREWLELILTDTTITIGRGQAALSQVVKLTTDGQATNKFVGNWTTKEAAINQLFSQYIRFSGAQQFKWYVDFAGMFRWFEVNKRLATPLQFFNNDDRVLGFKATKNATGVLNDFTGYYGAEEDQTSVHLQNTASIAKYGLRPADPITKTDYTVEEMTNYLQQQLDQKSEEIYTGTLTLTGMQMIETGTQLQFPDNQKYSGVEWTVVDQTYNIEPGKITTTLGVSTDNSVISLPNDYDTVYAIAKKEVDDNKAVTAIVTNIPTEGDRCDVWMAGPEGSGVVVNIRNPGGNWRHEA